MGLALNTREAQAKAQVTAAAKAQAAALQPRPLGGNGLRRP